jgi:uncharacterized Zn-finger protein
MSKKHKCEYCDKTFSSPQSKCNHKTIKHKNYVPIEIINNNSNVCTYCNKEYSNRSSLTRHLESYCKTKTQLINEKKEIYENLIYSNKYKDEKEILKLKIKLQNDKELELEKIKDKNIHLEEIINKLSLPMNNQLINIIEDKNTSSNGENPINFNPFCTGLSKNRENKARLIRLIISIKITLNINLEIMNSTGEHIE